MSWDNRIDIRLQCATCRQILDVKDSAYCRADSEGYTGVIFNPKPCTACLNLAREKAQVEQKQRLDQGYRQQFAVELDELTELRKWRERAKRIDAASDRIAKTFRGRFIGWLTRYWFPEESKI